MRTVLNPAWHSSDSHLGNDGGVFVTNGSGVNLDLAAVSKTFIVTNPSSAEDVAIHFDKAHTITKIVAVLKGSSSPSVTWNLKKDADRSASGTSVLSSNQVTTNTTTGDSVTSFSSAAIAAGTFLRLITSAISGTVTELSVTVHMEKT